MVPDRDADHVAPVDRAVPVDATLQRDLRLVESAVDAYVEQQSAERLRELEDALARLDARTADSDAWIAGVTNTASWGIDPKGTVIGETGNAPIVEDVPGSVLNAQIELVKAAKEMVRDATPKSLGVLIEARAALDAVRAP